MAFTLGHRFKLAPPSPLPRDKRTAEDVLDLVLRVLAVVPLLVLYGWWVGSTIWRGLAVLVGG